MKFKRLEIENEKWKWKKNPREFSRSENLAGLWHDIDAKRLYDKEGGERWLVRMVRVRMAKVLRTQEGPSPKSLELDENFKPKLTRFCRDIKIYALFGNLWAKKVLIESKTVFLGPYYIAYIAYYTQLNLQICNCAQKWRLFREIVNTHLTKKFYGHFTLAERLPTSATLLRVVREVKWAVFYLWVYSNPVNHNLHLQHDLHNFFKNWDMKGEPYKTKDAEFSFRVSLSNLIQQIFVC